MHEAIVRSAIADVTAAINDAFEASGGHYSKARPKIIGLLKAVKTEIYSGLEQQLILDRDGRACAAAICEFHDALIALIYDFITTRVYPSSNPSSGEKMAVVATGGYGRALMAPRSDVDLLFLLPYKLTGWGESVIEATLYLLWDMGLKVGHATRTVDQCVHLSRSDMTIRTSLLDSRLILGEAALFQAFRDAFLSQVVKGTAPEFIEAKLAERDRRHRSTGESRYLVEPNVKDGKGGLRDLHTLHWILSYCDPEIAGDKFYDLMSPLPDSEPGDVETIDGVLSAREQGTFRRAEDFLWRVRCHIHFLRGRPDERLTFDLQLDVAERLGYRDRDGLRAVERFMKHYFLVAKDVGDLTRIVCAGLELRQLKPLPRLRELLDPSQWGWGGLSTPDLSGDPDFCVENGRLTVCDAQVFEREPVNIIRLFEVAEEHALSLHPHVVRTVRQSLRLIDDDLRANADANARFLKLLTKGDDIERILRRLNETGVLGRFIVDFGRIVAMAQFNMYHHYTVDEHLIRTVGVVARIAKGRLEEEHPLATRIFPLLKFPHLLFVAAFLHDIAKGRPEDHSIAGEAVAREVCPRLGLSPRETDHVAWLVREHLTMSNVAQTRDIQDAKTVRAFAETVQSVERLRMLLVLTVADIRAVGPGVFTGWKGQLLRELYSRTEPLLSGGQPTLPQEARVAQARGEFKASAQAQGVAADDFIAMHFDPYWLQTEPELQ